MKTIPFCMSAWVFNAERKFNHKNVKHSLNWTPPCGYLWHQMRPSSLLCPLLLEIKGYCINPVIQLKLHFISTVAFGRLHSFWIEQPVIISFNVPLSDQDENSYLCVNHWWHSKLCFGTIYPHHFRMGDFLWYYQS